MHSYIGAAQHTENLFVDKFDLSIYVVRLYNHVQHIPIFPTYIIDFQPILLTSQPILLTSQPILLTSQPIVLTSQPVLLTS